ncbi:MAG: LVIVD repeat-containing protein [Chloroflexota bacterium]
MQTTSTETRGGEETWNMRLVGHTDMNGHGDGMHINLKDGFAFVGHMGDSRVGTSIVDVSDPTAPRVVNEILTPPGTHSHKVQIVGDLLVVNNERNPEEREAPEWAHGLRLFDVSKADRPREVGFFNTPGKGVHRMTYWHEPYVTMSGSDEGYTDQFFIAAELSDPSHPKEVGRWWMPGMHESAGEERTWPQGRRSAMHHAIFRGDRAYVGWWDSGLIILDVADITAPTLVSHLDFGAEVSGCTHTALPIPGKDYLIVTDESTRDPGKEVQKQVWVVDIADERDPKVVAKFPVPEGDFATRGGRFGPHNIHEGRPGTLQDPNTIYLTYFNAGVRVVDIANPLEPREIAFYVPETPPGQQAPAFNDILVGPDGLIYVTDRYHGGLYILERTAQS